MRERERADEKPTKQKTKKRGHKRTTPGVRIENGVVFNV